MKIRKKHGATWTCPHLSKRFMSCNGIAWIILRHPTRQVPTEPSWVPSLDSVSWFGTEQMRQASSVIRVGSEWLDTTLMRSYRLTNGDNLCRTFRHNILPTSVFCIGPALVLVRSLNSDIPNQIVICFLLLYNQM